MAEAVDDPTDRRSRAQWEAAGRLDGNLLAQRLRTEREIRHSADAAEEDAPNGDGASSGAAGSPNAPLRRAVENAVPETERLLSGADENPISQRVRDIADG